MTEIPKDLLLQQGRPCPGTILSHAGLFVVAWLLLRMVKSLSGTASIIMRLLLATSATPVFGLAVLEPLLGRTSGVPWDSWLGDQTVPPAVILLGDGLQQQQRINAAAGSFEAERPRNGTNAGLKSPLLWAPSLESPVVLLSIHLRQW